MDQCRAGLICKYYVSGYFNFVEFMHTQTNTRGNRVQVENEKVIRIDNERGVLKLEECDLIDSNLANIKIRTSFMYKEEVLHSTSSYVVKRNLIVPLVEWDYSKR